MHLDEINPDMLTVASSIAKALHTSTYICGPSSGAPNTTCRFFWWRTGENTVMPTVLRVVAGKMNANFSSHYLVHHALPPIGEELCTGDLVPVPFNACIG